MKKVQHVTLNVVPRRRLKGTRKRRYRAMQCSGVEKPHPSSTAAVETVLYQSTSKRQKTDKYLSPTFNYDQSVSQAETLRPDNNINIIK